ARAAPAALDAALEAGRACYDRTRELSRFRRLSKEIIDAETPEASRLIVREIENAMRIERGRAGHWSYDLNRHISLLVAHRVENARLRALTGVGREER
ncbi:MAG: DUF6477 family protein, partial [Methylocystis sp.]|nr:DUF6477 family protein [Methylocystis sp.]